MLTVCVLSNLSWEPKPVTLIVPGPDPDEPTTVAPLARSTVCATLVEVRFSGPSKVTPLSVPPLPANPTPADVAVPPVIAPPFNRTSWPNDADPSNVWPELL